MVYNLEDFSVCYLLVIQKQFSELLLKAASDYGALTAAVADFQWSQNFRESPSVWGVCSEIFLLITCHISANVVIIW